MMELDEYRRIAAASEHHWWYRATRALLQQTVVPHLPPLTTDTIYLDAAGGTGATGRWLADRATTVLDDYEPFALGIARDESAGYRPVRADINRIPHRAGAFDAVVCVTALYHRLNPDPQVVVDEFARVVKPGGIVCLMEPGVKRIWRSHDDVTHAARRFSLDDMRRLIRTAGLTLTYATGAYSFLVPPAAALSVVSRLSPGSTDNDVAASDIGRSDGRLGALAGAIAAAERKLLARTSLPFGLSVLAIGRKERQ
jgi:ubiquinone/menaquinone biosynthesis C-methylase UbiE